MSSSLVLPYNVSENLQTSETYISKTFHVNDKIGRIAKNAIFYSTSKVCTCGSQSANTASDGVLIGCLNCSETKLKGLSKQEINEPPYN